MNAPAGAATRASGRLASASGSKAAKATALPKGPGAKPKGAGTKKAAKPTASETGSKGQNPTKRKRASPEASKEVGKVGGKRATTRAPRLGTVVELATGQSSDEDALRMSLLESRVNGDCWNAESLLDMARRAKVYEEDDVEAASQCVRQLEDLRSQVSGEQLKRVISCMANAREARQLLLALKAPPAPLSGVSALATSATDGVSRPRIKESDLRFLMFSGKVAEYAVWWSAFRRAVMDDPVLTAEEKLGYLCRCLREVPDFDAGAFFGQPGPKEKGLATALAFLEARYASPHALREQLMNRVKDRPKLPKTPSVEQWREMYVLCESVYAHHDRLDASERTDYRIQLGFLLHDDHLLQFYERKDRSMSALVEFVKGHYEVAQLAAQERMGRIALGAPHVAQTKPTAKASHAKSAKRLDTAHTFLTKGTSECPFCKGGHEPARCPLSVQQRHDACKQESNRRCFRCLKPFTPRVKGKRTHFCPKVVCGIDGCIGAHHPALCDGSRRPGQGEQAVAGTSAGQAAKAQG